LSVLVLIAENAHKKSRSLKFADFANKGFQPIKACFLSLLTDYDPSRISV